MISTQTQTLILQGFSSQLDLKGNIITYINKERLFAELEQLELDRNGCIRLFCEKRYKKASNGKKHTHMAPLVEKRTSTILPNSPSPASEQSTIPAFVTPTAKESTDDHVDNW